MGLDMNLYRETYVKNWKFQKESEHHDITIKRGGKTRTDIKPERIMSVVEDVAYWRKANAIHNWFVEHCGKGIDECQRISVDYKDLQTLLKTVNTVLDSIELVDGKVLTGKKFDAKTKQLVEIYADGKVVKDATIAHELLPTKEGFFFGDTDYNEAYVEDLIKTKEVLEDLLEQPEDFDQSFYYQASW